MDDSDFIKIYRIYSLFLQTLIDKMLDFKKFKFNNILEIILFIILRF
jgi:hypothetical protein